MWTCVPFSLEGEEEKKRLQSYLQQKYIFAANFFFFLQGPITVCIAMFLP